MSTKPESSFSIDDVLKLSQACITDKDPKPEELLSKLRKLQEAKHVLEEEVKEALHIRSSLQEEEDALSKEVLKLEEILNENEETCRSLQVKCEDLEQETQRQLELKQQKEEIVEQYKCQIQETKLRHRKIRMKFENQLQQLMAQHKNLSTLFIPERLPIEEQSGEYSTQQLLTTENLNLEQAAHLPEEISEEQATDAPTMMHDKSFLHILHT